MHMYKHTKQARQRIVFQLHTKSYLVMQEGEGMEGEVAERGRVAMGAQTRRKHTVIHIDTRPQTRQRHNAWAGILPGIGVFREQRKKLRWFINRSLKY